MIMKIFGKNRAGSFNLLRVDLIPIEIEENLLNVKKIVENE